MRYVDQIIVSHCIYLLTINSVELGDSKLFVRIFFSLLPGIYGIDCSLQNGSLFSRSLSPITNGNVILLMFYFLYVFLNFQTNYQSKRSVIINLSRSPTTRSDPSELSNESVSSTVHDRTSGNLSSSSNLNSTDHSYASKGDEPNILQVRNFIQQVLYKLNRAKICTYVRSAIQIALLLQSL